MIVERIKRGLAHARANGKIGGGRYKLSPADQREAIRLIQVEKKSHWHKLGTAVDIRTDLMQGILTPYEIQKMLPTAKVCRTYMRRLVTKYPYRFRKYMSGGYERFAIQADPARITELCENQ
jgi:hypothetical protein